MEAGNGADRRNARQTDSRIGNEKIPYILIVGDKEAAENSVSVRSRQGDGGRYLNSIVSNGLFFTRSIFEAAAKVVDKSYVFDSLFLLPLWREYFP